MKITELLEGRGEEVLQYTTFIGKTHEVDAMRERFEKFGAELFKRGFTWRQSPVGRDGTFSKIEYGTDDEINVTIQGPTSVKSVKTFVRVKQTHISPTAGDIGRSVPYDIKWLDTAANIDKALNAEDL